MYVGVAFIRCGWRSLEAPRTPRRLCDLEIVGKRERSDFSSVTGDINTPRTEHFFKTHIAADVVSHAQGLLVRRLARNERSCWGVSRAGSYRFSFANSSAVGNISTAPRFPRIAISSMFLTYRLAADYPLTDGLIRCRAARSATANTLVVWFSLSIALLPFLVGFGRMMVGLLGMPVAASALKRTEVAHHSGAHYTSMIMFQPSKPLPVVTPTTQSRGEGSSTPKEIPFDGAYWYFQEPDTRPDAKAHAITGDPIKEPARVTNRIPLVMEAHQSLPQTLDLACCRALAVKVLNGDAVPGMISLEVLVRETKVQRTETFSLGSKVLRSSTVTPMPLNRSPVPESLSFAIPADAKAHRVDEITIRVKPDMARKLAGAKVKIESFSPVRYL